MGTIINESVDIACKMNYPPNDHVSDYYDNISALQKSIRNSDPNAALLHLTVLLNVV